MKSEESDLNYVPPLTLKLDNRGDFVTWVESLAVASHPLQPE
jgi:hypothetical protein